MSNKIIIPIVLLFLVLVGYFVFMKGPTQTSQQPTPQPSISQSQTEVKTTTITIKDFSFNPNILTVKQGETVTWVNEDSVPHKITSSTFSSEDLNQGDTFKFTFGTKGNFDYICGIHPSMKGKVVVE